MYTDCTLTLLLWQYRAYVMDSVSSGQAIITSHHHSPIYYLYAPCNIVYHTIPILSPSFLYHPYIPSFLIRRIFHLLVKEKCNYVYKGKVMCDKMLMSNYAIFIVEMLHSLIGLLAVAKIILYTGNYDCMHCKNTHDQRLNIWRQVVVHV